MYIITMGTAVYGYICYEFLGLVGSILEFLAEQRRVCGDTKEYVSPYTRKSGKVKGHCRIGRSTGSSAQRRTGRLSGAAALTRFFPSP